MTSVAGAVGRGVRGMATGALLIQALVMYAVTAGVLFRVDDELRRRRYVRGRVAMLAVLADGALIYAASRGELAAVYATGWIPLLGVVAVFHRVRTRGLMGPAAVARMVLPIIVITVGWFGVLSAVAK